ncbi:TetR/AcrR family transcriptional regulator [Phytomonospora sp. NPDC050363]|uniref:TetR/AcrR family transcriptional regulator n=1 Tax=Phytomonospora sp. NPDC050363 TaxID=3155642 RepID=UPI0033C8A9FF
MTEQPTGHRIAAAALAILVDEGAEAVTMRRVATAAGITPMAIYKHYPDRLALLRSVADAAFGEVGGTWGRAGGDFRARFDGLLDDFLDFALGQPHLYAFLLTDRREQARRFPQDFGHGASPLYRHVVKAVEDGMRDGILRADDPLEVALSFTSSTQGLVQLYLGGRIGLPEKDFRELCRRTAWRIFDGIKA